MKPVLTVRQLAVNYDDKPVLTNIEFDLAKGEIIGLLGASGCGKSTLLNAIAGFVPLTAGQIQLSQKALITPQRFMPPEKRQVGLIFQDYALFPHLTLADNIAFGIQRWGESQRDEKVSQLLALLKLQGLEDRFPHQLSGGQQQRVAIARALAPEPKLLLLDEPFSNIDARLRHELIDELRALLKQLEMSAIFVTHNKDEVFAFADRMAVMYAGRLLQLDSPQTVCRQPADYHVADFLQLGNLLPVLSRQQSIAFTDLGPINCQADVTDKGNVALIKPQDIALNSDESGNAKVTRVSVTDHGFRMQAVLLKSQQQVVCYAEQASVAGQTVRLSLKPDAQAILL